MGWRYLLFTLGGLTLVLWGLRFFVFDLIESPRYLIGKGRDDDAVQVIQKIAAYNGVPIDLTLDKLENCGYSPAVSDNAQGKSVMSKTSSYTIEHVKGLF